MYLSKLIPEFFHGFVKIFVRITLSYTWICQNCYMDLIVFTWIVKVVLCISRPLSNKTKLKFYKDFNTCWSFCFELKVFNAESKYSMPRFRCVFGNVFTFETHSGSCLDESHLWNHDVQAHHRCRHDLHHQQSVWKCNSPPCSFLCQMLAPSSPMKTNWGRRQTQIYQEEKSEKFKGKMDLRPEGSLH